MVVKCKLKVPSFRLTVWHHTVSLMIQNSYPREGIFNPRLATIKESSNLILGQVARSDAYGLRFDPRIWQHSLVEIVREIVYG